MNDKLYERIMEAISREIKRAIMQLDECDGGCDCGGAVDVGAGMYNNAFNTVGMGDVVSAGMDTLGSGDRFDNFFPGDKKPTSSKKRKIKVYKKK